MQPSSQDALLSVLGVIQYRERVPGTVAIEADTDNDSALGKAVDDDVQHHGDATPESFANSIEDLKAIATDLGSDKDKAVARSESSSELLSATQSVEQKPEGTDASSRCFDMRFWRCGDLLAIETSASELESTASDETKHRLVNNIFYAIFGSGTSGAAMYNQSWPDAVMPERTSDKDALDWLSMFLKGQLAKYPNTKLWLMGDDALELLLAEVGEPERLEGLSHRDKNLGLEVYVTPSLDRMIKQPYLKAAAWQLLQKLRRVKV